MKKSPDVMDEITSRDSAIYARLLIGRARHLMFKARQKELAPYRITPRQANVLFVLYNLGHRATLGELSVYTDRRINAISMLMARMEKQKLVKKGRESPKTTLLSFELTENGINAYKNIKKMTITKGIMSILPEEELEQFISSLKKIIKQAEKYQ